MLQLIKPIQIFIPLDLCVIFLGSCHCSLNLPSYQHNLSKSSSTALDVPPPHPWWAVPAPKIGQGCRTMSFTTPPPRAWSSYKLTMDVNATPKICGIGILIILRWRHLRISRCRECCLTSFFYHKAGHQISHEKSVLPGPGQPEHSCPCPMDLCNLRK